MDTPQGAGRASAETSAGTAGSPAEIVAASLRDKHVCPFCGTINDTQDAKCPRCTLEDTPAVRQATKLRIGPWYVLQSRNPAAPGMRFSTLLSLVQKGQVTARSIVRGPTSHQLWRFAARVKGLSREFGVCYGCGGDIKRSDHLCPHCQRVQDPPSNPDVLLEGWTSAADQAESSAAAAQTAPIPRASDIVLPTPPQAVEPRPRGFVPPVVERPTPTPESRLSERVIDPEELADALAIRMEPRGSRRMFKSAGMFVMMTLVGVATWLLIDRDSQKLVFNWFSDSFSAIRGTYREPALRPKTPPMPPKSPPAPVELRTPGVMDPATRPGSTVSRDRTGDSETPIDPPNKLIEESRRLWREAMDAEARGDWAGAVRKYEAIKKLPPTAWMEGVDLRLSRAKEKLR